MSTHRAAPRRSGPAARPGQVLLTLGAVLGLACLLLALVAPLVGVRPLLFRSGSMAPAIATGDLALARSVSAGELDVGDIVSVPTDAGERVTHRVVGISARGERASLTLRGDANDSADPAPYLVTEADRVFLVVSFAGRVIAFLASPLALMLLAILAALALLRPRPPDQPGRAGGGRRRTPTAKRVRRRAAPVALAAILGVTVSAAPAHAVWTDGVPVTSGALTASATAAPTLSCTNLGLLSLRFDWTAVPDATGYTFYANNGANSVYTTGTTVIAGSLISGGSAWVVAHRAFGSTTWNSAQSNSVSYLVIALALCA